jgi:hypothetical protein
MNSRAEPLPVMLEDEVFREISQASGPLTTGGWTPERFASEQIRGLVQRIFLASQPPCRQVVFSAVDPDTDIRELCRQVGETLTEHVRKVCIVDGLSEKAYGGMTGEPIFGRGVSGVVRDSSRQLSGPLWLVSSEALWGGPDEVCSAELLGRRLNQLRSEFDGCVIQAPAAGTSSMAGLLGRLSDGLILIVEAHSTHRLAAQRAQSMLLAANAKLLGTVLSERTFPIPEKLYRRL